MDTIWASVTWNIARASGFTAYLLLTLAIIVGLALSTQLQSPARWPRLLNSELHNFLTLLGTIFLGIHLLAVWINPFTHFGLTELLVPLASHYRPFWMALGIVGLYLALAIGLSTWLRPRIGYKMWQRLHVLTLGVFVLATIHGLGSGSDTQTPWALGIYLAGTLFVGVLLVRRVFVARQHKQAQAHKATLAAAKPATGAGASARPQPHPPVRQQTQVVASTPSTSLQAPAGRR